VSFHFDDRGANLIEWGILVSVIAIVALVAVGLIGNDTSSMFSEIETGFP
jgi:Flp pilus assembly pilin Flp